MATETFKPGNTGNTSKYSFTASGMGPSQHNPFEGAASKFASDASSMRSNSNGDYALMIRKLAQSTSQENLESMLIFAQDLVSVDFVADKDMGYKTAIARFSKLTSAQHVQSMLHGKPNTGRDANMIVEVVQLSPGGSVIPRRGTLEQRETGSADSSAFSVQPHRQASKFNGTFQELNRVSPPRVSTFGNNDMNKQDPSYQSYFSPTSPIGQPLERQRVSGKSMIGEDGVDDETKELLNDPMGYAQTNGGGSIRSSNGQRRSTVPHLPSAAFQGLSLNNTGMASPPISGIMSPRSSSIMSPSSYSPPNLANMGPNASYQFSNQHYMRPNFPPINPSDQNPPCNTLYVGNLPMDTSEDELKQMFIKQRGYKRLCFRTKANGPMCFVEFEDIQTASKALTECYGLPLHNSTKGGIRLSFSKNPLGVRGGQPGNMGMTSPISPNQMGGMNGYGGMQSYSSVTGPPPGLAAPPGLQSINTANSASLNGIGSPLGSSMNGAFSNPMSPTGGMSSLRSPTSAMGPGGWPTQGGQVPDYMMGR